MAGGLRGGRSFSGSATECAEWSGELLRKSQRNARGTLGWRRARIALGGLRAGVPSWGLCWFSPASTSLAPTLDAAPVRPVRWGLADASPPPGRPAGLGCELLSPTHPAGTSPPARFTPPSGAPSAHSAYQPTNELAAALRPAREPQKPLRPPAQRASARTLPSPTHQQADRGTPSPSTHTRNLRSRFAQRASERALPAANPPTSRLRRPPARPPVEPQEPLRPPSEPQSAHSLTNPPTSWPRHFLPARPPAEPQEPLRPA